MITAYIGGTFDLFHIGHIRLFKNALNVADKLVVAINTDEFNLRYKGKKPLYSLHERIEILQSCRYVNEVIINEGDEDSTVSILKVKPNIIVHGNEWEQTSLMKQMGITEKFLLDNGIELILLPYTTTISTTIICNQLK